MESNTVGPSSCTAVRVGETLDSPIFRGGFSNCPREGYPLPLSLPLLSSCLSVSRAKHAVHVISPGSDGLDHSHLLSQESLGTADDSHFRQSSVYLSSGRLPLTFITSLSSSLYSTISQFLFLLLPFLPSPSLFIRPAIDAAESPPRPSPAPVPTSFQPSPPPLSPQSWHISHPSEFRPTLLRAREK